MADAQWGLIYNIVKTQFIRLLSIESCSSLVIFILSAPISSLSLWEVKVATHNPPGLRKYPDCAKSGCSQ